VRPVLLWSYLNSSRLRVLFCIKYIFCFLRRFRGGAIETKRSSQLTSADDNNNDRGVYDERPRARDVCARLCDVFTRIVLG